MAGNRRGKRLTLALSLTLCLYDEIIIQKIHEFCGGDDDDDDDGTSGSLKGRDTSGVSVGGDVRGPTHRRRQRPANSGNAQTRNTAELFSHFPLSAEGEVYDKILSFFIM